MTDGETGKNRVVKREGQFDHRALVYDDVGAVAREIARSVAEDVRDDHAVLLCVTAPVAAQVSQLVPPDDRLHVLPVSDHDWRWYEAACNEVLDDLALTATCLYNMIDCPASALAMVTATHDVADYLGFNSSASRSHFSSEEPARPPLGCGPFR